VSLCERETERKSEIKVEKGENKKERDMGRNERKRKR